MKQFLSLILIFISLSSFAQEVLTIREVFDYNIGDEFHSKSNLSGQPPNADRLTIIEKSYNANKDTLYYKIARNNYSTNWESRPGSKLIYYFVHDTLQVSYTNLDSSIFYRSESFRYDTIVKYWDTRFRYDSIIENSVDYCGTLVNGFDCWLGDFEPSRYTYIYGRGIGKIMERIYEGDCGCDTPIFYKSLFYYKKSGMECGTPDKTTGIEDQILNDQVKIYPNPASQYLNIDLPVQTSEFRLKLFDAKGMLVKTQNGNRSTLLNISGLPGGIYFINITVNNGVLNRKVLIQ